ncbi:MAG: hypothetical protein HYV26_04990 [Candidatus Hydrogenedentes bacterium]|nr:hypothetical protein [Candidatus Hydrogenedentota bacterium]
MRNVIQVSSEFLIQARLIFLAIAALLPCVSGLAEPQPFHAQLRGLDLRIHPETGGLLEMTYAGLKLLEAAPEEASLLDMAWPAFGFEPLRLGTRYSKDVRIEENDGAVEIHWNALGLSRDFAPRGRVAATVRLAPAPDGASLILSVSIDNQSEFSIPQILFPDFSGLRPFAGEEDTALRTCGFNKKPFVELKLPGDDGRWYAARRNWLELKSGAYDKSMAARWLDFGSLQGGFSLFPRLWSWGPLNPAGEPVSDHVWLHLPQDGAGLRLMCEHRTTVAPGTQWTSPEYVLTPHKNGWAKGIAPFREWVLSNVARPHPFPARLRETLGYRTVWMAQQYAQADPAAPTVVWRFSDLPGLAEECRDHGLNEMVLWLWQPWELPHLPSPELGTLEEFNIALAQCREIGVNVSLFVSVMTLLDPLGAKYGWTDAKEHWGYHTDFVPMLRPYYGQASRGSFAEQTHPGWQADVSASLLKMIERGWNSITWDQAFYAADEPNLTAIFSQVRQAARARDPESTFAAEDLNNLDLDSRWLDYTWNWVLFDESLDLRALVNAYPTPRFNVNAGSSPGTVKRLFMDHLFMNVLPSKPENINGSARIAEYPELSQALKTCAQLHAQFLPYFEDGLLIGDCILTTPCHNARVNAYVLPDRLLLLAMNTVAGPRDIELSVDIGPWLDTARGPYTIISYDERGEASSPREQTQERWEEVMRAQPPGELFLLEVVSSRTHLQP